MKSSQFPIRVRALPCDQPLGRFFVVVLPSWLLLDTCYADKAFAKRNGESYTIEGVQRGNKESRLKDIASYIKRYESAFPNSIILAANYDFETGLHIEAGEHSEDRWEVEEEDGAFWLLIPSDRRVAQIVDGQHRLFGFSEVVLGDTPFQLVCSVFIDLPKPFQAQLFAVINSTQVAVNKSLTYELFGYNVDSEPEAAWGPDKVAVFIARKLNIDDASPLVGHVLVAAENDFALTRASARLKKTWVVSMATVVEGILRLLTSNPRRDASRLGSMPLDERRRSDLASIRDDAPFRKFYCEGNDRLLYSALVNYMVAYRDLVWDRVPYDSYAKKTVGVQAMFDVLRILLPAALVARDVSVGYWKERLAGVERIDFSSHAIQNPSGVGRRLIRLVVLTAIGASVAPVSAEDVALISEVIR